MSECRKHGESSAEAKVKDGRGEQVVSGDELYNEGCGRYRDWRSDPTNPSYSAVHQSDFNDCLDFRKFLVIGSFSSII